MADSSKLQYLVMKQDGNGVVVVGPDPSWGSVTWAQPNVLMAGVVSVTVLLGRGHLPSTQRIWLNDSQVMEANS